MILEIGLTLFAFYYLPLWCALVMAAMIISDGVMFMTDNW